jgi:site-specific recombinase XerD
MKQNLFLKQLAAFFDVYLPNKNCSKNTISAYAYGFTLFFEYMESVKSRAHNLIEYSELTPRLFDDYVLWMKNEKKYSPASQKQRIAAIASFLKYASRREMSAVYAYNSIVSTSTPKIPDQIFPYFSTTEIKLLLSVTKTNQKSGIRDLILLSLMYDSGARAQEICNLNIGDLYFCNTSKIRLQGKGCKAREVPISKEVVKMLKIYLAKHNKSITANKNEPLFSSQRLERMTTACIRNIVKKYVALSKKENPSLFKCESYSPHSLRHSKAVHMLEAGVPLIYIRNFLGHESVQTTEIYARVSQEGLNNAVKQHSLKTNIQAKLLISDKEQKKTANFLEKYL